MTMPYTFDIATDMQWQNLTQWQTPDTPFMRFDYWQGLSDSHAIGRKADWLPLYIVVKREGHSDNAPLAVMPVFIKHHHQGEYVFDHAWADAYQRYGADYYPRLVTSVPFTPVTGERIWLAMHQQLTAELWQVFNTAIATIAEQIKASSWHGLFFDKNSLEKIKKSFGVSLLNPNDFSSHPSTSSGRTDKGETEIITRYGCQFLWHNLTKTGEKFADFEDFLAILTAKKRKSIRVERQKIAHQGITCQIKLGNAISESDWEIFYQCYAMTYFVRGRQPYLPPKFFNHIAQTMPNHLMLAQAVDSMGEIVASSLFFYDDDAKVSTLYGRYWGSLAAFDSLHFELCYYQGIAFAIERGLAYFDPGTQGEHKLIRGFIPTLSYSMHQIFDKKFAPAIADFCEQERAGVLAYYEDAMTALPFNQDYQDFLQKYFNPNNT